MKRIASRIVFTIFLVLLVFSGYQLLESSTYPQEQSGARREKEDRHYYSSAEIPDSLTFAGEKVPLEYFDVYESLDREMLVNSYFHSQTLRFIKMAPRFFPMIEPILKENQIPEDFKYLALAESGFDPRALSPAGAAGFWQFLKGTAKDYGMEVSEQVDERYHIEKSTLAACRYLRQSYGVYGNWTMVAASYNAGRAFVSRQIDRQQQTSYYDLLIGEETTRYVFRILALKLILENPAKYGFQVAPEEMYQKWNTKTIQVSGSITSLTDFAKEHGTNYKILKMLNPWLRDTQLINTAGKTYEIKLPVEGFRFKQIDTDAENRNSSH